MAEPDRAAIKKQITDLANEIAEERDYDILIFNFGLEPGFDTNFLNFLDCRKLKRKNLLLFLTTEGGDADAGYRMARYLQDTRMALSALL